MNHEITKKVAGAPCADPTRHLYDDTLCINEILLTVSDATNITGDDIFNGRELDVL